MKSNLRKPLVLLLALTMLVSILSACGGGGTAASDTGTDAAVAEDSAASVADSGTVTTNSDGEKVLVYAVPEAPTYLDPHNQATIAIYRATTQIFDRLVLLNNDMEIVPRLAESWEVEDDRTTVFHLRDNIYFHNGDHMTSEDVKWSLERTIASPGVNYNYLIIEEIEIVDDYTFKIITNEPFNALLYRLSLDAASIVNRKAVEEGDEKFNQHPVGAGPFKFVSWDLGGDVVLEAFDDYYLGRPEIDKIIIRHIPEAINRTIGLETGEVGVALDLATNDIETVKANDNLQFIETASPTMWFLGFNCENEKFKDERVRQAFAYAINIPDFIDIAFNGMADPANYTMVSAKMFGSAAPKNVDYSYNIEKAKELLAEAGYPDGLQSTIWCLDNQLDTDCAVVLQGQLRQIGVELEVQPTEQGRFFSEAGAGKHEMIVLSKTSIDVDSHLRAMYHTEALGPSGNRQFWTDPEVDRLLDEACAVPDLDEAKELYAEVQEIVAEHLPLIPLCSEYINAGMQNNVSGFGLYPGKTHYIYGTQMG